MEREKVDTIEVCFNAPRNSVRHLLSGFMTSMLDSGLLDLGSSPGWCHQGGKVTTGVGTN